VYFGFRKIPCSPFPNPLNSGISSVFGRFIENYPRNLWEKSKNIFMAFLNNGTCLIVIVTKLAENRSKNNSKYIMKCVILSLKNKKVFGL
jgi:hypothetical protein